MASTPTTSSWSSPPNTPWPFGERGFFNLYYAAMGDPAMGPIAFPHRASAMEMPQAALSHHWQDSTHIATNVVTVGAGNNLVRLEASGFHGREPDENRWNINMGKMNSWSSRLTVFSTANWSAQASFARLKNPEATHEGNVSRTTTSLHYVAPREGGNWVAASLLWGINSKSGGGRTTQAVLAEAVVPLSLRNFVTGRFEWSQRDELVLGDHEHDEPHVYNVAAFTAGYTRDIWTTRSTQIGVGANFTAYAQASALRPYYGDHPVGATVFLRVRLRRAM